MKTINPAHAQKQIWMIGNRQDKLYSFGVLVKSEITPSGKMAWFVVPVISKSTIMNGFFVPRDHTSFSESISLDIRSPMMIMDLQIRDCSCIGTITNDETFQDLKEEAENCYKNRNYVVESIREMEEMYRHEHEKEINEHARRYK
jgi:hypothetical protein